MRIQVLDVDYTARPHHIVASIEAAENEVVRGDERFSASGTDGRWKIHDFARTAPADANNAKQLVALEEVGNCGRLRLGQELRLIECPA